MLVDFCRNVVGALLPFRVVLRHGRFEPETCHVKPALIVHQLTIVRIYLDNLMKTCALAADLKTAIIFGDDEFLDSEAAAAFNWVQPLVGGRCHISITFDDK
ncbi:hypothetical protein [Sphingobium sp.]|uniref:hypothetical protein n=1 Tax=Sphingobium sp. TaxID=1912891 RepID=UPI002C4C53B5|nr:hypothetical protein [Sphingobium sp.]HUD95397.1 hypothetical protein [Sphingobium sp.]